MLHGGFDSDLDTGLVRGPGPVALLLEQILPVHQFLGPPVPAGIVGNRVVKHDDPFAAFGEIDKNSFLGVRDVVIVSVQVVKDQHVVVRP